MMEQAAARPVSTYDCANDPDIPVADCDGVTQCRENLLIINEESCITDVPI